MKTHRTVTLTKQRIKFRLPCEQGFKTATPFLPATFSTDPEENIELAVELVNQEVDVSWLFYKFEIRDQHTIKAWFYAKTGQSFAYTSDWETLRYFNDPYVVAQLLAILAEKLLGAKR